MVNNLKHKNVDLYDFIQAGGKMQKGDMLFNPRTKTLVEVEGDFDKSCSPILGKGDFVICWTQE